MIRSVVQIDQSLTRDMTPISNLDSWYLNRNSTFELKLDLNSQSRTRSNTWPKIRLLTPRSNLDIWPWTRLKTWHRHLSSASHTQHWFKTRLPTPTPDLRLDLNVGSGSDFRPEIHPRTWLPNWNLTSIDPHIRHKTWL